MSRRIVTDAATMSCIKNAVAHRVCGGTRRLRRRRLGHGPQRVRSLAVSLHTLASRHKRVAH